MRALDEAQLEALLHERAPQAAHEERAQEAVGRLDGRRLGHGHADAHVGRQEEIERGVRDAGAEVEEDVVGAELAQAS